MILKNTKQNKPEQKTSKQEKTKQRKKHKRHTLIYILKNTEKFTCGHSHFQDKDFPLGQTGKGKASGL